MLDIGSGYVPDFIRKEVLPSAPSAGEGVHRFLFDLARVLTPYRSASAIEQILRNYARQCGRHVPDSEIKSAIRDGKRYAWQPDSLRAPVDAYVPLSPPHPMPKFEAEVFKAFAGGQPRIDSCWLAERSPVALGNQTPASFLHALYRKGEKVIVFDDFHSQGQELWTHPGLPYETRALDHFACGRRFGVWFLCNPVDGHFRLNDAGERSRRSHQNVTSWRYMVVESDRTDIVASDWLAAIAQLPLPIAAICETGGRLPHALLRLDAPSKQDWDRIRDSLRPAFVMLGADLGSLSAVRLTRLPCCERLGSQDKRGGYHKFQDGAHFQRLVYLNPHPDDTPIALLQPRGT